MLRPPPWIAAEGYTYCSTTAVVLQYCTVVLYCCLQQQQTGAGYHTRFEKWGARYLWSAVPLPFAPLQYAPFLFVAAVYTSMARSYSYCHLGTEHLFLWSISYFSKSLRLNFLTASFLRGGRICTPPAYLYMACSYMESNFVLLADGHNHLRCLVNKERSSTKICLECRFADKTTFFPLKCVYFGSTA